MTIDHAAARMVNPDGTMTKAWYDAMKELGICAECGSITQDNGECDNCGYVPEVTPHYHVVDFIDGCLNDYDSGPYETLEDARSELRSIMEHPMQLAKFEQAGEDRYIYDNIHILKIEKCSQDCEDI
jgi:hypothetical protein